MKKIIKITALILATLAAHAQIWSPNKKVIAATAKDTNKAKPGQTPKVQCWGTTKKGERCKHQCNPETATKDAAGHSLCFQYANQQ